MQVVTGIVYKYKIMAANLSKGKDAKLWVYGYNL
jgi:hypothetical protein